MVGGWVGGWVGGSVWVCKEVHCAVGLTAAFTQVHGVWRKCACVRARADTRIHRLSKSASCSSSTLPDSVCSRIQTGYQHGATHQNAAGPAVRRCVCVPLRTRCCPLPTPARVAVKGGFRVHLWRGGGSKLRWRPSFSGRSARGTCPGCPSRQTGWLVGPRSITSASMHLSTGCWTSWGESL